MVVLVQVDGNDTHQPTTGVIAIQVDGNDAGARGRHIQPKKPTAAGVRIWQVDRFLGADLAGRPDFRVRIWQVGVRASWAGRSHRRASR